MGGGVAITRPKRELSGQDCSSRYRIYMSAKFISCVWESDNASISSSKTNQADYVSEHRQQGTTLPSLTFQVIKA